MSPDHRTSLLGPSARHTVRKAGILASLALVLAAGAAGPAAAAHGTAGATATTARAGGDDCNGNRPHPDQKSPAESPGTTGGGDECDTTGGGGGGPCTDIDAVQFNDNYELRAALTGGRTYAGIRDISGAVPGFLWTDLSNLPNYPSTACAVSITEHSSAPNSVEIDVLTTGGQVWETTCSTTNSPPPPPIHPILVCTSPWVQQHSPTPNAVNG